MARLGGDEFVVILEHTAERDDIEAIARKLLSAVEPAAAIERPRMPHHAPASASPCFPPTAPTCRR